IQKTPHIRGVFCNRCVVWVTVNIATHSFLKRNDINDALIKPQWNLVFLPNRNDKNPLKVLM
ncbi:MAG: hypothetical protein WBL09_02020, partial [Tepidanaerobacteraceae bacterium]